MLLQATVAVLVNRKWKYSRNLSCNSVRNNKTNKGSNWTSERLWKRFNGLSEKPSTSLPTVLHKENWSNAVFLQVQTKWATVISHSAEVDQETLQPIRDDGGKKVSLGSLLIPEHQQILKTDYICEYVHFFSPQSPLVSLVALIKMGNINSQLRWVTLHTRHFHKCLPRSTSYQSLQPVVCEQNM